LIGILLCIKPAGLTIHPDLALPKNVDPVLGYNGFLLYCKKVGRVMKFALLHWARVYPGEITGFLINVKSNQFFRRFYRNCYDAMRFLYRRIFNIHAMRVCIIEEKLNNDLTEQLKVAQAEKINAVEEMKVRDQRVAYLQAMIDSQDSVERARWREYYPELPGQVRKRELKRARSRSRGRSQSRGRSKIRRIGNDSSKGSSNAIPERSNHVANSGSESDIIDGNKESVLVMDPAPIEDIAPVGGSGSIIDPFASDSDTEAVGKKKMAKNVENGLGAHTIDPEPESVLDNGNVSIMMEIVEVDEEMFLEDFSLPIPKARKIVPEKRKMKGKKKPAKVLTDAEKLAASVEVETREEDVELEFEFSEFL